MKSFCSNKFNCWSHNCLTRLFPFTAAEGKQKLYGNHRALHFNIIMCCCGKTSIKQQLTTSCLFCVSETESSRLAHHLLPPAFSRPTHKQSHRPRRECTPPCRSRRLCRWCRRLCWHLMGWRCRLWCGCRRSCSELLRPLWSVWSPLWGRLQKEKKPNLMLRTDHETKLNATQWVMRSL